MRQFTDSSSIAGDPGAMKKRLDEEGYLFFRGLLPDEPVLQVRRQVIDIISARGWLAPDSDSLTGIAGPQARREDHHDPDWLDAYTVIQALQSFHELGHHPVLTSLMASLLGDPLLVHPRKMLRVMLPELVDDTTPVHQDYRVVQGTVDVLTAWLPLGDCPLSLGGVKILDGSTRIGLVPIKVAGGVFGQEIEISPEHPAWVGTDYRAGDVLVFHSLTIHSGMPNRTPHIRLSADYRYQVASDPVTIGSLLPYYFPWLAGWEELTRKWTSFDAIKRPRSLNMAPTFDPRTPSLGAPPSKLVTVGGTDGFRLMHSAIAQG